MDISMDTEATDNLSPHSSMSFHMDRGRLVCNECNGYFPNLVLFENHSHQDQSDVQKTGQPVRSGPKSAHVTFSSYSDEDLQKAFHNMPELSGCWIQNGKYYCGQCGKEFDNPYILFSHKILHPQDRVMLKSVTSSVKTQTNKPKAIAKRKYASHDSDHSSDDDWCKVYPFRNKVQYALTVENVAKQGNRTVVHVTEDEHVHADLTTVCAVEQAAKPGPSMVMQECYESDATTSDDSSKGDDYHGKGRKVRTVIPAIVDNKKCHKKSTAWRTYVTKYDQPLDARSKNRDAKPGSSVSSGKPQKSLTTNPGCEKGLVFTDMDAKVSLKVFRKLPGLGNCSVDHNGNFMCDKCTHSFENPYLLFTHRLQHMLTKTPNPESNLVFYNMPGLKNCKMDDGKFHCDGCAESFNNPYLLFTHRMKHDIEDEDDDPAASADVQSDDSLSIGNMFNSSCLEKCKIYRGRYLCNECDAVFRNPYLLLNHKVLHRKDRSAAGKSDDVAVVNEVSVDATKLKEISVSVLDIENETTSTAVDDDCYECNMCQLQFETMDSLVTHVKGHIKKEDTSTDSAGEVTPGSREETNLISQRQTTPSFPAQCTQTGDANCSTERIYHRISSIREVTPSSQDETTCSLAQGAQTKDASLSTTKVDHIHSNTGPIREVTPSSQRETIGISQGETTSSPSRATIVYPRQPNIDSIREVSPSSQTGRNPFSQEETTPSSHVSSHRTVKRIKVKVAIVPVKSDFDTNMVHFEPRIPLKRAVIKLERLDVDPSDIVIIPS